MLLCDPSYELHERFGIKKGAKGTVRSVIVIKKGEEGKNAVILKKSIASPANSVSIAEKAIGIEKKPADEEKTD